MVQLTKPLYLKAELNDERLTKRFNELIGQLKADTGGSIPQAAQSKGAAKGMYRFFHNPKVKPHKLIQAHVAAFSLSDEGMNTSRYLCLSDSTEVDYTSKRGAANLGPLSESNRRGMYLHNSLIISDKGIPGCVLKQDYLIRRDEDFCKWKQRKNWPIENKESNRWLKHFEAAQRWSERCTKEVVYVADREADIMELYHARRYELMHFLTRSQHNRCIANSELKLYQQLAKMQQVGTYELELIDPKTLKPNLVTLGVRFCKVTLRLAGRAKRHKHLSPLVVTAIEVRQVQTPTQTDPPIRWVLLTSLPIATFADALQAIRYYVLRWIIERFHYLLKSGGARIEELQMEKSHQLQNAITTYSIVIMDSMKIRYLADKEPNKSALDVGITPLECEILYAYVRKKSNRQIAFDLQNPPTIWEFCRVLGSIAGFIPSKRQPLPGLKTLSKAVEKFHILLDAYDAYMSLNSKDVGYH